MEKVYELLRKIQNSPDNYELFAELSEILNEDKINIIKKENKFYEIIKELLSNTNIASFIDAIFNIDEAIIKKLNLTIDDKDIIRNLIDISEKNFSSLKDIIIQDKELLLEILKKFPVIYNRWLDEVYQDIELMKFMININPTLIYIASENVLNDESFMYEFIEKGINLKRIRADYVLKYKDLIINLQGTKYYDSILFDISRNEMIHHLTYGTGEYIIQACKDQNEQRNKVHNMISKKTIVQINIDNPLIRGRYRYRYDASLKGKIKDQIKKFRNIIFEFTSIAFVGEYFTFVDSFKPEKIKNPEDLKIKLIQYSLLDENNISKEQIEKSIDKYFTHFIQLLDMNIKNNFKSTSFSREVLPLIYHLIKQNKVEEFFAIYKDMTRVDFSVNIIDLMDEDNEFLCLIANTDSILVNCTKEEMNKLKFLYKSMGKFDKEQNRRLQILDNLYKANIVQMIEIEKLTEEDIENLFKIGYSKLYSATDYDWDFVFEDEDDLTDYRKYNFGFYPKTMQELKEYEKRSDINISLKLASKVLADDAIKSIIFYKYFNMNFKEAQTHIKNFIKNLKNIEQYPNLKKFKDLYDLINKETDSKKLIYIYYSLEKTQLKNNLINFIKELNEIKAEYFKEIIDTITPPPQVGKDNVITIDENFNGGKFNMLIHVVGAYSQLTEKNAHEAWFTDKFATNNSLCCSYISNDNLGTAKTRRSSVILGFTGLEPDALELMSPIDLYSSNLNAHRESIFMKSQNLKNNTRYGHNELTIRRRKGELGNEKISPSYIVCFDHINKESKKASEDFGIPIYLIKTEAIVKNEYENIERLKREFSMTLDSELIKEIIVKQENNAAGLHYREKLQRQYFSREYRQGNLEFILNAILQEIRNNFDYDRIYKLMKTLSKVYTDEKEKYILKNDTSGRYRFFDLNLVEKYNEVAKEFLEVEQKLNSTTKNTI